MLWQQFRVTGFRAVLVALIVVVTGIVASQKILFRYYLQHGIESVRSGEMEQAERYLAIAVRLDRDHPLPHAFLGMAALGRPAPGNREYFPDADYRAAIGAYEHALANDLREADRRLHRLAVQNTGYAYWKLGEYERAHEYFRNQITLYLDAFWPRYLLAVDLVNRFNQPEDALEILSPITEGISPDDDYRDVSENIFRAHTLLARLHLYFGDLKNVEKFSKLAIAHDADSGEIEIQVAHLTLALGYALQGNLVAALSEQGEAERLAERSGSPPRVYTCVTARLYQLTADYRRAINVAEERLAGREPSQLTDAFCLEAMIEAHVAGGNTPAAARYARAYLALADGFEAKNIFIQRNLSRYREQFSL